MLPDPNQTTIEDIVPQQDASLRDLVKLCEALGEFEDQAARLADELAQKQSAVKRLGERIIPDLMEQMGLTSLNLTNGKKIEIKPVVFASVSKDRMERVKAWLTEHNFQAIIKNQLTVDESNKQKMEQAGIEFTENPSIHSSTLRAFVKERLEEDPDNFPKELFAVTEGKRAVIK